MRTFTEDDVRDLLSAMDIIQLDPSHYVLSGPFESAAGDIDVEQLREMESRLQNHPITAPLNRAWMAAARLRG